MSKILSVLTILFLASSAFAGNNSPRSITANLVGNSSTATALASSPTVCSGNNFSLGIAASGNASCAQPSFGNLSGSASAAQLPNPSASTLGGIESLASTVHQWINTISTSGVPSSTQPAFSDISGTATNAQLPTSTVTAGSYTTSNITVNAQGIVTAAANGTGGGSGTVTSASVVSANGFTGTVATATTTPAITLTTSITGVLKGNGTALSAATAGTDYSAGTSANTTGIVKSTTVTGALTTAIAADFPTLNQNTSGTAAGPASGTSHGVVSLNSSAQFQSVAPGTANNVLTDNGTDWVSAAPPAATVVQAFDMTNVGFAVSEAANALTISLKQKDGATNCAAGGGSCNISFRSSTITSGAWTSVAVSAALSLVIPSGTTLGTVSANREPIWVYAINNAGTAELAASVNGRFDPNFVQTTTAISGGASRSTLYSTTARTAVPIRLFGIFYSTQATAGTWVTAPANLALAPWDINTWVTHTARITNGGSCAISSQDGGWLTSATFTSICHCALVWPVTTFSASPICTMMAESGDWVYQSVASSTAGVTTCTESPSGGGTNVNDNYNVICMGPR